MATNPIPLSPQQRDANRLAELLTTTAGELAARTDRRPVTAATPERVDAVTMLAGLGQRLPDFCQRAILGEVDNDEWDQIADALARAARACREQIVITLHPTDDEGGAHHHRSEMES